MILSKYNLYLWAFLLTFYFAIISHAKGVTCPSCMHALLMTHNLPSEQKYEMYKIMLPVLKLSDDKCESGNTVPKVCKTTQITSLIVHKCQTKNFTLKAFGMKNMFPDADLEVRVMMRECVSELSGNAFMCTKLGVVDYTLPKEIRIPLNQLEALWQNVTYTGDLCRYSG
ncbi:uncharacterized protein LOC123524359 [Mercenaria mercenaria]|uniref:uncharacterized protein LOC123524359 n=1 Tax=Mercenaria mercenaria TaxID=6596 RepID=UPI00234EC633|nr:uncharacterized protein LOC123524359 [Mercenaria mercenaria]